MKFRRLAALVLALAMILSSLAGCGGGGNISFEPANMKATVYYKSHTETILPDYNGWTYDDSPFTQITSEVAITHQDLETSVPVKVLDTANRYDAASNTYLVGTAEELMLWGEAARKAAEDYGQPLNCTLTNDINLAGQIWTPIGNDYTNTFTGTFDGGGHTITGLNVVVTEGECGGLFGTIGEGGTVQNLTLANPTVSVTSGEQNVGIYAGGIAGFSLGSIDCCTVTGGSVTATNTNKGSAYVGGIAGQNLGSITDCNVTDGSIKADGGEDSYADADVYAGSIVGENLYGSIGGCTVSGGNVTANGTEDDYALAGGIVGRNYDGSITSCTVTSGSVKADGGEDGYASAYAGGIAGRNYGRITDCTVTANSDYATSCAGGIAGVNDSAISNCTVTGGIITATVIGGGTTDDVNAGGIAGHNNDSIIGCTVTSGSIKANSGGDGHADAYAGGIAGSNADVQSYNGNITDCTVDGVSVTATATNTEDGKASAGGIAGHNDGNIKECRVFNDTQITATAHSSASVGGIAGRNYGSIDGCTVTGGIITATVVGRGDTDYGLAGGIAGENWSGAINGCTVTGGSVTANSHTESNVGGIVGYNGEGNHSSSINSCTVTGGTITATADHLGDAYADKIVGMDSCIASIGNCTAVDCTVTTGLYTA